MLHHESTEWLETIAFWKDEMRFFDKLLHLSDPLVSDLKTQREMLESLERIQGLILDQLEKEVTEHEKYLAKLERNKDGADWDYREKHRRLKEEMEALDTDFKDFKKVVFSYVKSL